LIFPRCSLSTRLLSLPNHRASPIKRPAQMLNLARCLNPRCDFGHARGCCNLPRGRRARWHIHPGTGARPAHADSQSAADYGGRPYADIRSIEAAFSARFYQSFRDRSASAMSADGFFRERGRLARQRRWSVCASHAPGDRRKCDGCRRPRRVPLERTPAERGVFAPHERENLAGLAALNRELLARAEGIDSLRRIVLDMDSTEVRVHGRQEQSA
jgi:hypothetical protein